jgi:hypothetical protein
MYLFKAATAGIRKHQKFAKCNKIAKGAKSLQQPPKKKNAHCKLQVQLDLT